jgi:hypothetical protein
VFTQHAGRVGRELGPPFVFREWLIHSIIRRAAARRSFSLRSSSSSDRVVSMLSKLVDRFSPVTQVRKNRVRSAIEDEDENDGRESPSV